VCSSDLGYFIDTNGEKQNCGNGKFADLSVFSFHPVKHIATGEGGMITTNNESLYKNLLRLRTHGITREKNEFINTKIIACGGVESNEYPGWYMEMHDLGYNYRITDFQAALGKSQLSRAESGLTRRIQIAKKYSDSFEGKSYIKGHSGFIEGHAYHLYILEVEDRLGLYNFLKKQNILCQVHYIPCHLMPYYKNFGWKEGDMYYAEEYYKKCISIPMYPSLSDEEVDYVIININKYYEKYSCHTS
jgi:dTDP-4-amino-4,6-dideoxygalactose transaminase